MRALPGPARARGVLGWLQVDADPSPSALDDFRQAYGFRRRPDGRVQVGWGGVRCAALWPLRYGSAHGHQSPVPSHQSLSAACIIVSTARELTHCARGLRTARTAQQPVPLLQDRMCRARAT